MPKDPKAIVILFIVFGTTLSFLSFAMFAVTGVYIGRVGIILLLALGVGFASLFGWMY